MTVEAPKPEMKEYDCRNLTTCVQGINYTTTPVDCTWEQFYAKHDVKLAPDVAKAIGTPSTHKSLVVRLKDIVPHPNADRLEIVKIGGYQCVVGKGQFKVGDLAVHIQPDSIVPQNPVFSFIWEKDGGGNPRTFAPDEVVPEKYRRVTVRRFRKEWSEGLLMKLEELFPEATPYTDISIPGHGVGTTTGFKFAVKGSVWYIEEGADVADLLGIKHWEPAEEELSSTLRDPRKQYRKFPRSLKGWIYFLCYWLTFGHYDLNGNTGGTNEKAPQYAPSIYDVEALKNYQDTFLPGELVVVTEKIHGSNARYTFDGKKVYAGSRRLWKRPGNNIWRQVLENTPDIALWCRANPGCTLYGEVVPTQGGFSYGYTKENPHFFAFDVLTPQGWLDREHLLASLAGFEIELAPKLYFGPYDTEAILPFVDGPSVVPGAKHIREGVVIKTAAERIARGLGRAQLKIVSNSFLEKDSK